MERRKHISFKNNKRENDLLEFANKKSELLGFSAYIKLLIEKDMNKEVENNELSSKSR